MTKKTIILIIIIFTIFTSAFCDKHDDTIKKVMALSKKTASDPISNPEPSSTLLPTGTTSFSLTLSTLAPTTCAYSIGSLLPFEQMTAFDSTETTFTHTTIIRGLSADPKITNNVYIRCAASPDFLLTLKYRSLPDANPDFPRTGNLWGWWGIVGKGLEYCADIDLWLGADFSESQVQTLRTLNPDILILPDINTVENKNLPDDYYLKDVSGNKIEVWPGSFRLNLTKNYVAEFQANYAYQIMLDSNLIYDGCFFDNFMTSQSWLQHDIHGNRIYIDADEDGIADDPDEFDAKWRAGVFYELSIWKKKMPYAITTGHLPRAKDPGVAEIFHGDSVGFITAEALDRTVPFGDAWSDYNDWCNLGRHPYNVTMLHSEPQYEISYGYDYNPLQKIPASTLEFAHSYYPYIRFGLALTLMNDGYFSHAFGDTHHGNDWRFDELYFNLGKPKNFAYRINIPGTPQNNIILNNGFESALSPSWTYWVNTSVGCQAVIERTTSEKFSGTASAHMKVTNTGEGVSWHIALYQKNVAVQQGVIYDFSFYAKSSANRTIGTSLQKQTADWRGYGLGEDFNITTEWKKYEATFTATETVNDGKIQFFVGDVLGDVWIDDVAIVQHPPDVYRRDYDNGVVYLNGTYERREIILEKGLRRIVSSEAPRYQYIIDDTETSFTCSAEWVKTEYDSGMWKDSGPFYHDWAAYCHANQGTAGTAEWILDIQQDDYYTIKAWYPAGPDMTKRTHSAYYEILSGSDVITTKTLDQSIHGDEWNEVARVYLKAGSVNRVRVTNPSGGESIADALHVYSDKRYNDGSPVNKLVLEPMDGIILQREPEKFSQNLWLTK